VVTTHEVNVQKDRIPADLYHRAMGGDESSDGRRPDVKIEIGGHQPAGSCGQQSDGTGTGVDKGGKNPEARLTKTSRDSFPYRDLGQIVALIQLYAELRQNVTGGLKPSGRRHGFILHAPLMKSKFAGPGSWSIEQSLTMR
jgi:hypothetical protein